MKNKVEARPRKVNKKNSVVEPIRDVDVKHLLLNENFEPICTTCKKSMFDGVHDMCLLDLVEIVNSQAKSAKKHKNKRDLSRPPSLTLLTNLPVGIKSLLDVTVIKIYLLLDMDSESAHMVAASKVPMIKPENGNSAPKTTIVEVVEKVIPLTTVEEKAQKRL
ncbi:hypothetical protein Tco_1351366 [Tanacetum coccineum]